MAHRDQSAAAAGTVHLEPILRGARRTGGRAAVFGGVILPDLNTNKRYSVEKKQRSASLEPAESAAVAGYEYKLYKQRSASLEPAQSAAVADYETSVEKNGKVKTAKWIEITVRDMMTGTKIVCKCVDPKTRIRDFRKEVLSICGLTQTHAGCGILRIASEHSFLKEKKKKTTTASVHRSDSNASIFSEREGEKDSDWSWQEGKNDTNGSKALSRSWPSPPDEATLDEAWEMSRRQNQDPARQTSKPVIEVLDEDARPLLGPLIPHQGGEKRELSLSVLQLACLEPPSRQQCTVQTKLKPLRTKITGKSCSVRPKGKHHTSSTKSASASIGTAEVDEDKHDDGFPKSAEADIGAAKVDKDDDGDTMEKQRRKILLLWEYSTLVDDHENLLTLARHCVLPAMQTLEAQETNSEGRGGGSAIAVADEDYRRNERCLDSDGASKDHWQGGTAFATWQPSTQPIKQLKVKQASIKEEPDGTMPAQDTTVWKELGLMNGRLYKLNLSQAKVKQAKIEEVTHIAMLAQDMSLWKGLGLLNGRVYKLNLSGCQPPLQGSSVIGPELGLLAELERINFNNNKISGPLPLLECLGRLTQLRQLSISNNQISGSLRNISVLKHLTNLELSRNAITGLIPPELGSLEQLVSLNLSHNKLTGTMPSEMSGLSNLRVLNLSYNKLRGHLKSWVGSLSRLQRIDLGYNRLEGSLPSALTRLGGLEYLHLPHNQLRGGLPMDVLACLNVKIREIFLQGNPLYFVPVETENADMIRKNKYILEDLYSHCNAVFV